MFITIENDEKVILKAKIRKILKKYGIKGEDLLGCSDLLFDAIKEQLNVYTEDDFD